MRTVYMKISDDEYELPEAVADTKQELSIMLGRNKSYACQVIKYCKKNGKKSTIVEVEVDDE